MQHITRSINLDYRGKAPFVCLFSQLPLQKLAVIAFRSFAVAHFPMLVAFIHRLRFAMKNDVLTAG
jgi:hypothetical protein